MLLRVEDRQSYNGTRYALKVCVLNRNEMPPQMYESHMKKTTTGHKNGAVPSGPTLDLLLAV